MKFKVGDKVKISDAGLQTTMGVPASRVSNFLGEVLTVSLVDTDGTCHLKESGYFWWDTDGLELADKDPKEKLYMAADLSFGYHQQVKTAPASLEDLVNYLVKNFPEELEEGQIKIYEITPVEFEYQPATLKIVE